MLVLSKHEPLTQPSDPDGQSYSSEQGMSSKLSNLNLHPGGAGCPNGGGQAVLVEAEEHLLLPDLLWV